MVGESLSIAQRLADVNRQLTSLSTSRITAVERHEDALAFSRADDVAGTRKEIAKIDSAIETAQAMQRGLERRVVLEQRDSLQATLSAALDHEKTRNTEFASADAAFKQACEEYSRCDGERTAALNKMNGAHSQSFEANKVFQTYIRERAADIERAEALVGNN